MKMSIAFALSSLTVSSRFSVKWQLFKWKNWLWQASFLYSQTNKKPNNYQRMLFLTVNTGSLASVANLLKIQQCFLSFQLLQVSARFMQTFSLFECVKMWNSFLANCTCTKPSMFLHKFLAFWHAFIWNFLNNILIEIFELHCAVCFHESFWSFGHWHSQFNLKDFFFTCKRLLPINLYIQISTQLNNVDCFWLWLCQLTAWKPTLQLWSFKCIFQVAKMHTKFSNICFALNMKCRNWLWICEKFAEDQNHWMWINKKMAISMPMTAAFLLEQQQNVSHGSTFLNNFKIVCEWLSTKQEHLFHFWNSACYLANETMA